MKRLLTYAIIIIAVPTLAFLALITASDELQPYSQIIGFIFILLVMIAAGAIVIVGMIKLTMSAFFKKEESQEEPIPDKDDPIDRYVK